MGVDMVSHIWGLVWFHIYRGPYGFIYMGVDMVSHIYGSIWFHKYGDGCGFTCMGSIWFHIYGGRYGFTYMEVDTVSQIWGSRAAISFPLFLCLLFLFYFIHLKKHNKKLQQRPKQN